nr:hypothetical protein [Tanacetum cinerariifolium]
MYHKKNVDFAYLLCEDFVYQVEHKDAKKSNEMYYPRFTKVIVNFFMTKDQSILRRNKVNWHYARDDHMFTTIKLVSRHQNTQQHGVILHVKLTNEDIKNSKSYKEYYAIALGAKPPKTKASVRKKESSSDTTVPPITKCKRLKTSAKVDKPAKEKQPAKSSTAKGVLDVSNYESDDEEISYKSSDEDDDNDDDEEKISEHDDDDQNKQDNDDDQDKDDDEQTDSDNDSDDFVHSKFSTHDEEAKNEESFDPIVRTPSHDDKTNDEDNDEDSDGMNVEGDEGANKEDDADELYRDVNINIEDRDIHMADTSYAVAIDLSELELKKILTGKMESNKSIHRSDEQKNLYNALVDAYEYEEPSVGSNQGSKRRREGKEPESTSATKEKTSKTSGKSTEGSKSQHKIANKSAPTEEPMHTTQDLEEPAPQEFETGATDDQPPWISNLAKKADSRTLFNKMIDTPVNFSSFAMNQLKVDTLTLELLAGPTYELMKGSCKSLVELEFFLEEPLPLIPNSEGRRIIPFNHFINNDLGYLRSGASSQKYTTSVTKTKTADYRHIKWIEDLFYGFAVNRESAQDVYSKRRIIAITELQIIEWQNYKHLDWIIVRRDDDKLYKFKEGDFERLRIQDIKDIMLLLVQGKLTNLTVDKCFAFNVSLRMFTRSIVIQRRMKDLQLGVKSYQKKRGLTKPDKYRLDFKRKEAYTAYSNPRGFIYQNKDKQNRLMHIDELHKFNDGTLNDVRTALDDHLNGIRMQYLPQTIWR